jgi:hypothetical protein
MLVSFPALAQRVTVLGSTLKREATSPGVIKCSVSGIGLTRDFWALMWELPVIALLPAGWAGPLNGRGLSEFTSGTTPLVVIADQQGQKRNAPFVDALTLALFADYATL